MKNRLFDIITDTACDLTETYLTAHEVDFLKLGFTMNNVNYGGEDGEKIGEKEFYDKLRGGAMPTTYQVTSESAKTRMEAHLKAGRDVLALAFSSGLSGTHGSYVVAARELKEKYPNRKIVVIDSLCASMGQGLLVYYACQKADMGASIEETQAYIEDLKLHICHHFTVDSLFHLMRGGRVSGVTAVVGSLLKIKPVMYVNDEGKLIVRHKVMGRKKSISALVEGMEKSATLQKGDPIFISHGDCEEEALALKATLQEKYPDNEILVGYIGAVIGSHSGAGTLALFHLGNQR